MGLSYGIRYLKRYEIRYRINRSVISFLLDLNIPEATAPGVSPGRGLLIPHGYLHPGKCEHSEVQSSLMFAGRVTLIHGWTTSLISKIWRTVRSERGKDLKKHVRKLKNCFTQYNEKHFFPFFLKGMIRIDLVWEMVSW